MQDAESHNFFALIEAAEVNFFFYIRNREGGYRYVGPSQRSILGYTEKEFPEQFDTVLRGVTNAPVEKHKADIRPPFEVELQHKNGLRRYLQIYECPYYDNKGNLVGWQGLAEDMTRHKELEVSFQRNETFFKRAQRMAKIGSWFLDIGANRLQWSEQVYRIFEKDPSDFEASYEAFLSAIHPDDFESVNNAYIHSLEEKSPYRIEHRLLMPDGRIKYVQEECETFFDERGEAVSSFGTVQDITEMKELQLEHEINQEQMFHHSKMAQMGELINSIAHQWKQPLHQINSILPLVEEDYEEGILTKEALSEKLDEIEMLTNHMSQTIESFKEFFNPNKNKSVFSIGEVLNTVFTLFRGEFEQGKIGCELKMEKDFFVHGSEKEFVQAILTILNNARECFRHREVREPKITIGIGSREEGGIVTISDNAGGVSDLFVDKIFDPYFTTKRKGHGTGLGLYIAKKLIERGLGGTLSVENGGEGAVFTMRFPHVRDDG
ncbi:MAG: PAS domain-containing sensor histidine kinase [Helicobacteraceae bacterium]|jgi:PAS domain S-box-containing protein|nr:PAS domain-containing sensor histidine kinase [Helicobacteraceae bacterium]